MMKKIAKLVIHKERESNFQYHAYLWIAPKLIRYLKVRMDKARKITKQLPR